MTVSLPVIGMSVFILIVFCFISMSLYRYVYRKKIYREIIDLIHADQCYYTILDTRKEKDFQHSHIETACNMPFNPGSLYFPTENMFERIIVIGDSLNHVLKVVRRLSKTGYANVGYFGAWKHWGMPIIKDNE